ncbi:MAG: DUF4190 domain-containing protein [Desulfobacteraceae bacterium]|jgi:hypothetical protein
MNQQTTEKKPNNLALASVLLGFFCISLPSVVCGHLALYRIKHNKGNFTNTDKRMAIGGLFFGYIGIFLWLYLLLLVGAMIFNWDLSAIFPFGVRN